MRGSFPRSKGVVLVDWTSFDGGSTVGEHGGEGGVIIKDEEFDSAARITLEKLSDGEFVVTCGIYGTLVHTAWFNELSIYEKMKSDIENILSQENEDEYHRLIEEFINKY